MFARASSVNRAECFPCSSSATTRWRRPTSLSRLPLRPATSTGSGSSEGASRLRSQQPGTGAAGRPMSLAVVAGKKLLAQVVEVLVRYENKNTTALLKAWDDAKDEWLVELVRVLPEVVGRLEQVEQFQERLNRRTESPEFQRL